MILDDIKNKLEEIDPKVFYGMAGNIETKTQWDYIVFDRDSMKSNANKTGYTHVYNVAIVRENFIPEGLLFEVIDKMQEINGMRFSGNDATYTYMEKPTTNKVVEMAVLQFVKPVKV